MTIQDNEWLQEQQRVDDTVRKVKDKKKSLVSQVKTVKEEADEIKQNFWEDVTVNLDEPDDVIETFTSIKQQAELLSERERSYRHVEENISILNKLEYSPYFARVDFKEQGEEKENIYIGIASFLDGDDYLVYDWRAPISSIYYDGSPGPVSYETPEGPRQGEMLLKRQFIIKDGQIESIFDTGVTIGDEMLQEVLGNRADTHMKNIVATIQKEQNKIIRDIKSRLLFVQGAAGSGKTSAALQRIAYLLYRFRDSLHSDQIILFSPNRLFNQYISKVLPELGENNMEQTTFLEFAQSRIPDLTVESLFEQFETSLNAADNHYRTKAIRLKNDLSFVHAITDYVDNLATSGLFFKDISFRGKILISKEEISNLFYSYDRSYSLPNRFPLIQKELLTRLKEIAREEEKKQWVEEEMELLDREDYLKAFQHSQKGEDDFNSFDQEKEFLAKQIVNNYFKKIRAGIKRNRFFHRKAQYVDFLKKVPELLTLKNYDIHANDWAEIQRSTIKSLNGKNIQMEDTVPYMYLYDLIVGRKSETSMKYVFIDEIQDYTPAQLAYMKFMFPYSKFTMLGDINQSIFNNGSDSPIQTSMKIFGEEKAEIIRLTKSYRSTAAITAFTKAILPDGEAIELFEREGELPSIVIEGTFEDLMDQIARQVERLALQSSSIAIIGKTMQDCEQAYHQLKDKIDISLIGLKNQELAEGPIILPSYLAKGLEFDSVIVLNASDDKYNDESERTLLYTICTRAMHHLIITSLYQPSHLFDRVPKKLYK
ncbi:DNA helicase UvrD [Heyndrickxia sporothermodurans]|uniref:AAA family ATPase n=1 Tax=Heyndrickxia sporothermodurans TaxID=46224 RepID=A0AB37HBM8_9BACI|nr:RNA polymerase recycling motor HelD [Heyndrickxia sporothermodurans]MBL5767825.1 AAA family ATPase [Heyndrickxia sporothermodurans]MBL5771408.1 AAA family ATPase [Heyndrickxia sporothermodurans]MBL5775133.1 AAA family ATPase [Heyndrickxia sporothermodurans]MBL5779051.1 AAA family ATPase [Heyndrickxia sporothermodurans]MBL5782080.1 AAA family ATPase [Heyndrickxia sporothermodurans]